MRILLTLALAAGTSGPAVSDTFGTLNPQEGGLDQLAEDIALHPDRVGALCWLAYETQKGGGRDAEHAADAMQICAASGNAPSMILLAHAYENGLGVIRSPELSTYWVREAAMAGYSLGQYHSGMALLAGDGTAPDPVLARLWLTRAAEQGSAPAQDALAQMDGTAASAGAAAPLATAEAGALTAPAPDLR